MKIILENIIFVPFVLVLLILTVLDPGRISSYYKYVDWKSIVNLTGLMVITFGIKESLVLTSVVRKMFEIIHKENVLAFSIVLISMILSMFLTNDIALFITIPLSLAFLNSIKNDMKKIIIFQALAVNVGSTLSPIGNPQNLFLWHKWNIPFFTFIVRLFPVFFIQFLILIVFLFFVFPCKTLSRVHVKNDSMQDKKLFYFSIVFLIFFVISMELKFSIYAFGIIALFYLFFYRSVLKKTDWGLILLFIIMFIDFNLIGKIPYVFKFMSTFNFEKGANAFIGSLISSQIMSNVPAAIFMSNFTHNWKATTFGVNVGGNGFIIASLANLIAIRISKNNNGWKDFHKYSIVFMVIVSGVIYLIYYS